MSQETSDEASPFLWEAKAGLDDTRKVSEQSIRNRISSRQTKYMAAVFVLQALMLGINIALIILNISVSYSRYDEHDITSNMHGQAISPMRHILRYKTEEAELAKSPFVGEHRPETDQAWSQLMRSATIKFTKEEMRSMNKTSISLRDGSGYIGYIESVHMLHCVKRFYQYLHPEHYPKIQDTGDFALEHFDHCLEVLRVGIMCNVDVTVSTYRWKGDNDIKGHRSGSRKCTDWSTVETWLDQRAVKFEGREEFLATLVRDGEAGSLGPDLRATGELP